MPEQIQNSFIPKRTTEKVTRRSGKKRIYLLGFISYILFFGVILAVAGMYGYQEYLRGKLSEQQALLANQRSSFDESKMNQVKELDVKLRAGEYLLDRHLATSRLFEEIQPIVTQNTFLGSFSYTRINNDDIQLLLSGRTSSLGEFIIQRDTLKESDVFANAEFSGVNYTNTSAEGSEGARVSQSGIAFSTSIQLEAGDLAYMPDGAPATTNQATTETESPEQPEEVEESTVENAPEGENESATSAADSVE